MNPIKQKHMCALIFLLLGCVHPIQPTLQPQNDARTQGQAHHIDVNNHLLHFVQASEASPRLHSLNVSIPHQSYHPTLNIVSSHHPMASAPCLLYTGTLNLLNVGIIKSQPCVLASFNSSHLLHQSALSNEQARGPQTYNLPQSTPLLPPPAMAPDVQNASSLPSLSLKKHPCLQSLTTNHPSKKKSLETYDCGYCGKQFTYESHLKLHIRTHTGEKPYSCHLCSKKFTQKSSLKRHARIHTGEKPFSCTFCNKQFKARSNLIRHTRIHTGEKPFSCHLCNKRFTQKSNLTTHIRIHTGEKPFTCSLCNKKCTTKWNLKIHLQTHTGEKPYSCTFCNKSFKTKSNLKTHIRTHTGAKPYQCDFCNKKFRTRSNLTRHVKIHNK